VVITSRSRFVMGCSDVRRIKIIELACQRGHHGGVSNTTVSLGAAIRRRRTSAGLSVRALATAAGLSASFISQVENDKARPRIETLHRIAAALDTTGQAILADASVTAHPAGHRHVVVSRASSGQLVHQSSDPDDGIVRSLVNSSNEFNAMEIRGAPAAFGAPYEHAGTELLYVISGRVEVDIGGDLHRLEPGDAINYPGEIPHRTRRLGPDVHLMIVTTSED
jgi:transcriptional regulator with XRE-family HTH domain